VLTQNVTVSLDASGAGSVNVADIDNGSTDNCTIATRTLSKSSFDCSNVGANTIWLRVTDANGNVDSASAVITVEDVIKPTVLTQNVTVSLDASGEGSVTVADIDNGSTDNCSISTRTLSKSSFDCSDVGSNTIYLIVTDVNGNVDSASAVITVEDVIKPTVLTQNVTVSLDASGAGSITATQVDNGSTDNCTIATRTLSKSSFDCSAVGANTIYLIVTDVNGNVDSASAVITVEDNIKPTVVTTPSDIALGYCDATYTYAIPTGDDNCSAIVTQIAGLAPGSTFPVGLTVNTFEISDPSGNTVTTSFTVDVRDRYLPFSLSDTSVCNNNAKIDLTKGFDNIIFIGNGVESNTRFLNPNLLNPGGYSITAEFTDSMGCISSEQFIIEIRLTPTIPMIDRVASDQIVTLSEYSNYQWYRNGEELEGENDQLLQVNKLGIYSVLVGNNENCFEASEGYGFGIPVNEENVTSRGLVKVFPNPTRDLIFVQINDNEEFHLLTLSDALGNQLITQETSTKVVKLDLISLASGKYYLNILGGTTNETIVVVKN
jgi:Ni,Fe-hydrogenase III small subunit